MQLIQGITSAPKQNISIPLPDGNSFSFTLEYRPQQLGWFYDIRFNTNAISFECLGRRLVTSPNILRQFQDVIPFGIGVVTAQSAEPTTQTAFTDGTTTMLLLDSADIADIDAAIYRGSN
jgi:hypothetical protein